MPNYIVRRFRTVNGVSEVKYAQNFNVPPNQIVWGDGELNAAQMAQGIANATIMYQQQPTPQPDAVGATFHALPV